MLLQQKFLTARQPRAHFISALRTITTDWLSGADVSQRIFGAAHRIRFCLVHDSSIQRTLSLSRRNKWKGNKKLKQRTKLRTSKGSDRKESSRSWSWVRDRAVHAMRWWSPDWMDVLRWKIIPTFGDAINFNVVISLQAKFVLFRSVLCYFFLSIFRRVHYAIG